MLASSCSIFRFQRFLHFYGSSVIASFFQIMKLVDEVWNHADEVDYLLLALLGKKFCQSVYSVMNIFEWLKCVIAELLKKWKAWRRINSEVLFQKRSNSYEYVILNLKMWNFFWRTIILRSGIFFFRKFMQDNLFV